MRPGVPVSEEVRRSLRGQDASLRENGGHRSNSAGTFDAVPASVSLKSMIRSSSFRLPFSRLAIRRAWSRLKPPKPVHAGLLNVLAGTGMKAAAEIPLL